MTRSLRMWIIGAAVAIFAVYGPACAQSIPSRTLLGVHLAEYHRMPTARKAVPSQQGPTPETINETATGPTEIGYVEASISAGSVPVGSGTLYISLAALGGPVMPGGSETCKSDGGCGFVSSQSPGFTPNSCAGPEIGQDAELVFTFSGTFCQEPTGEWNYKGSFTLTADGTEATSGTGSIDAAASANGDSSIMLTGVLAK
jgi:hypothetical protein